MEIINGNRKLKGNISVMVILILLACSLMGILTIIFLRSLIVYTDDSYGYYKSYYMAKAGLELALTEIDNTDVGFQNSIQSGDAVVVNNFDCPGCSFTSEIKGRSGFLGNYFWKNGVCSGDNKLVIPEGGSMVLPMFYDNSTGFSELLPGGYSSCLSGNECVNLFNKRNTLSMMVSNQGKEVNIGVIFLNSEDDISLEYLYMQTGGAGESFFRQYFEDFHAYYGDPNDINRNLLPYIVLSNSTNNDLKFCINNSETSDWPATRYFVSSIGEYMGKTVGLQAIYEQPVPSFLINPYLGL